jgi:hypothetical protein
LVFESVVDGGFGKVLTLEEGATLELGRFENRPKIDSSSNKVEPDTSNPNPDAALPESTPTPEDSQQPKDRKSRRFTTLNFRKAFQGRHVSGPALAVVDAEPSSPIITTDNKKGGNEDDDEEDGVKVVIRLVALDKEGIEMGNDQVTYLHVVRFGEKIKGDEEKEVEDKRPWVVKVVKREATVSTASVHILHHLTKPRSVHIHSTSTRSTVSPPTPPQQPPHYPLPKLPQQLTSTHRARPPKTQ